MIGQLKQSHLVALVLTIFIAPEAQEHLQCLIECIREMYSSNIRLREDLEKTTIKGDSLRYHKMKKTIHDAKEEVQMSLLKEL